MKGVATGDSARSGVVQGAYGLRITDIVEPALAVEGGAHWPEVRGKRLTGPADPAAGYLNADRALIHLVDGSSLVIDRPGRHFIYTSLAPPASDALLHPALGWVGALFATWRGDVPLHAGAFLGSGGAWGLLGDKGLGKSTTLAGLAAAGCQVLTDDLLVVSEMRALAGPRCIDLRHDAAEWLAVIGRPARNADRLRVHLPKIQAEHPLRGWIVLDWGPRTELKPVTGSARLEILLNNLALTVGTAAPMLLDLGGLPMWTLRRRRGPASFGAAMRLLCELTSG